MLKREGLDEESLGLAGKRQRNSFYENRKRRRNAYPVKARNETEKRDCTTSRKKIHQCISGTKLPTWNMKNSYSMEWTQCKGGGGYSGKEGMGEHME
jgi:hypothetical protein